MSKKKKRLKLQKRIQEIEQKKALALEESQKFSSNIFPEKEVSSKLNTDKKPVIIEENLEQKLFYIIALIALVFIFVPGAFLNKISIFLDNLFLIK